ncbi:glycosyl hydrolase family 18 protein [Kibdelosporangium philippinense]|uniref:Glycosyl hydrolase family 18 protein n=1 Tax=Kibdelosporangium philippinense TaxID=211113 RepID=A0ABS8Z7Q9_9PSEU|nr:glycosyl hydrolase family 18 protein [Kibdelosporangium philippinense]MCE7003860.1 glycosyl hydrolase family 18 protein [Kibdelosporangium philippinense]
MRISTVGAIVAVLVAGVAGQASAGYDQPRPIPKHVLAPYFQAYLPGDPGDLAEKSGARYLNLSFLHTNKPGECEVYWNGVPAAQPGYLEGIAKIRRNGGDVIPAFGGAYAGETHTEIADSCADIDAIAAAYQKTVTTYNVSRLDMDIEGDSLYNTAAIDRRNKALRKAQDWAKGQNRPLEIVYTIGTGPHEPNLDGIKLVRNAIENGVDVRMVNIMTFDFFDNKQHDMAQDAMTAGEALVKQLKELYPSKSNAQLWNMVGITAMVGLDDYGANGETGPKEVFTPANAIEVTVWAWLKGIGQLSFWALARDNGNCPGEHKEDCSGVEQAPWQYTRTMRLFTH